MPRDGRFIEKLGTYNPLLPKDSEDRVKMDVERVQYWLGQGAQPTDRVSRMLEAAGVIAKKDRANLKKGEPGKKAQERADAKADQGRRRRGSRRSARRGTCSRGSDRRIIGASRHETMARRGNPARHFRCVPSSLKDFPETDFTIRAVGTPPAQPRQSNLRQRAPRRTAADRHPESDAEKECTVSRDPH